jgi:hypothetical protein
MVTHRSSEVGTRPRRWALVAGAAVVTTYVALAAWSGHLSPTARGPLLDGLGPVNYRWVAPPPELASTNQPPSSGEFSLRLGARGVEGQVVFTSDNQVTAIVETGSIAARSGQQAITVTITPLDPTGLRPPGDDLSAFGNAVRIDARYEPSEDPVRRLSAPLDVILVYPGTSTLHAARHEMLHSVDGSPWRSLDSTDSTGQQTVEANVPAPGVVMVAGVASASPSPATQQDSGSTTLVTILLVLAGCALLVGVGLLLRSRRD